MSRRPGQCRMVLLLSDGMANFGIQDPGELETVAAGSAATISGIGLGYDETLLAAIARGGSGNHTFAEAADEAAAVVAGVVVHNDLPAQGVEGGIMVELGDLWAGERRTLLIGLGVPAAVGLAWRRSQSLSCATSRSRGSSRRP